MTDILTRARKLRAYIENNAPDLTDEEALDLPEAFPKWQSGKDYKVDERLRYGDKLYKVIQAHTSQEDWTPDKTPALFVEVAKPGEIPEWKQPAGAHDAYNAGDHVMHNGEEWVSLVDANIWEPGVYGWEAVLSAL